GPRGPTSPGSSGLWETPEASRSLPPRGWPAPSSVFSLRRAKTVAVPERKAACEKSCALARWLAKRGLGKRALGSWLSACTPNNYSRGNILFYQGNMPLGLYFLCQGRVKLVRGESRG